MTEYYNSKNRIHTVEDLKPPFNGGFKSVNQ
jgi:hypothetical protein